MGIKRARPLVIGEVLYDKFSDSEDLLLGGAPFNVAWNLFGFGLEPLFISRVGNDKDGNNIIKTMSDWGMDTSGVQLDDEHKTGRVLVNLAKDGSHTFDILSNRAYDFIYPPNTLSLIKDMDLSLIYHGSLIKRSALSANAVDYIIDYTKLPVFIDVNLRAPYWEYNELCKMVSKAKWLKLNDAELTELAKSPLPLPLEETSPSITDNAKENTIDSTIDNAIEQTKKLINTYSNIELIATTLGKDGAIIQSDTFAKHKSPPTNRKANKLVDTVGAGDAFASVMILGLTLGLDYKTILDMALSFSASVCRIKGALHKDKGFYRSFMDEWSGYGR